MENKCVMIADEDLGAGVLANTAAILGMTLGKRIPECVDKDVMDGSGFIHQGITNIPIPILKGDKVSIRRLREKLYESDFNDLLVVDFSEVAQNSMTYSDYIDKAVITAEEDFNYLGIAIYGNRKKIQKLTGSMPLLR
jgi:Uncharacterized protein conserved in bacteria